MRFNHEVKFYDDTKTGGYDPTHSGSVTAPTPVATHMANVTDSGTTRSVEQLGGLNTKAKIVRFVEPVRLNWSYITIDGTDIKYVLDTSRETLKGNILIVSVKNG